MREKKIDIDEKNIYISFPYDEILVNMVRNNFNGRRFDDSKKRWVVPLTSFNITRLIKVASKYGFEYSDRAKEVIEKTMSKIQEIREKSTSISANISVDGLSGELRPFQKAGVAFLSEVRKALLADEMGLGKTVQALAALEYTKSFPAVIVTPASLKLNWVKEAEKWLVNRKTVLLEDIQEGETADIYVINYDLLKKYLNEIKKINPVGVVFDESHYLKNSKAQRTKLAKEIAKGRDTIFLLTGTPVVNRPIELVSQLEILGKLKEFGGFWEFVERYCDAKETRWGWDFRGAKNLTELNEKLRSLCMIRREKSEVLKELPSKQVSYLPVKIDNMKEYRKAEANFAEWLKEKMISKEFLEEIKDLSEKEKERLIQQKVKKIDQTLRGEQLAIVNALRKLSAEGKINTVIEWVESFLESDQKLVLFTWHKEIAQKIAEHFQSGLITGDTPAHERQALVEDFQKNDNTKLIVLTIKAGGVGLTLTASSNVAFVETGWTPAEQDQAEDRVHRIGQSSNAVNVWYFIAEGTIDERIHRIIQQKRNITQQAIDANTFDELLSSYLLEIVKDDDIKKDEKKSLAVKL